MKRSEECAPCPAGQYCAGYGLKEPTGPCDAGFYCSGRACTSVSIKTGQAWFLLNFIMFFSLVQDVLEFIFLFL